MEPVSGFAKGAPERGAGSFDGTSEPAKLTEGFSRSVDTQTPPVSLTLNHLPFQGRRGRFAPDIPAAKKEDACFAAAPRPRVSKRPCLQEKLYFGSGFLSILFGCLILPKLASFGLHKFIYFTKMDGEAGEAENYT